MEFHLDIYTGELPWIFVSQTNSKKSSENMYNTNEKYSPYVTSGLITGTQWDVMLNKFIGTTNQNGVTFTLADMTNSSKWGNYASSSTPYTGRSATIFQSGSNLYISPWGTNQTNATTGTNTEFTTGASKKTEAYHTYDVAGNVWEWTEEVGQGTSYHVLRGGGCYDASGTGPACYRSGDCSMSFVHCVLGFRAVLYIK